MTTLQVSVSEYRRQLDKGVIQKAYRGLMEYIMGLRTHFQTKYPEYVVPSSIYHGYMDMTYFSLFPASLKDRKLKIAIVFIHEAIRFEAWLAGTNKQVQTKYWHLFKENCWRKYHLAPSIKGIDCIMDYVLVPNPDFDDLPGLTGQIEKEALVFIKDIEQFIAGQH